MNPPSASNHAAYPPLVTRQETQMEEHNFEPRTANASGTREWTMVHQRPPVSDTDEWTTIDLVTHPACGDFSQGDIWPDRKSCFSQMLEIAHG